MAMPRPEGRPLEPHRRSPPYARASLVDITGSPIAARIYMYGGTELLLADNPATSGDDDALMDDMLIGRNDPVDECLWIENLVDDDYGSPHLRHDAR